MNETYLRQELCEFEFYLFMRLFILKLFFKYLKQMKEFAQTTFA